jgi:hypothetical protein
VRPGIPMVTSDRQEVDGDTAYIVWKAETADSRFELGTEVMLHGPASRREGDRLGRVTVALSRHA